MSRVIAAVGNSAAAAPVLSMAVALGRVLGAEAEAVHVCNGDGDGETWRAAVTRCRVPSRVLHGDVCSSLLACAEDDDVVAVVVGARDRVRTSSVGHVALRLVDSVVKPVLVVPPEAPPTDRVHRVLIALEGSAKRSRRLRAAIDLAADADLELEVVHVDDEETVPSFSDQIAHECEAYAAEFLARYVHGVPKAHLQLRVGSPADEILELASALRPDVLVIGWPHDRSGGRGMVAREILDRAHLPVLLVATEA